MSFLATVRQKPRPKHSGTFAVRIADAFIDDPVRPCIAQGPRGFLRHGIAARMVQSWQRLPLPTDVVKVRGEIDGINPHVEFLRRFVGGLKEVIALINGNKVWIIGENFTGPAVAPEAKDTKAAAAGSFGLFSSAFCDHAIASASWWASVLISAIWL